MRFMMFIYPGEGAETGVLPTAEEIAEMSKFNQEMEDAGVLLSLDGLQPTSKGVRVRFPNGKPSVTDGPFTETKEIVGGYWMIQVKSKEEAVEWAKRVPLMDDKTIIELRQVFEAEDFQPIIEAAAQA